jgi:hypothetical protein
MGALLGFMEGVAQARWRVRVLACTAVFVVLGVTAARALATPPLSFRAVRLHAKASVRSACRAYNIRVPYGEHVRTVRTCHFVPGTRRKPRDLDCVRESPGRKNNIYCSGEFYSLIVSGPIPPGATSLHCSGGAQYSGSGSAFRIAGGGWEPHRQFICTPVAGIAGVGSEWSGLEPRTFAAVFSMRAARQAATSLFPMTPAVRWHLGRGRMIGVNVAKFHFTWRVPANHTFCSGRVRVGLVNGRYVARAVTTGCVA